MTKLNKSEDIATNSKTVFFEGKLTQIIIIIMKKKVKKKMPHTEVCIQTNMFEVLSILETLRTYTDSSTHSTSLTMKNVPSEVNSSRS